MALETTDYLEYARTILYLLIFLTIVVYGGVYLYNMNKPKILVVKLFD